MKSLFFLFSLITIFTVPSQADLVCRAVDKGWEEHSSGHGSCDECLQRHGSCEETCSIRFTTCQVTGKDIRGRTITLTASGDSRYEAEGEALDNCRRYLNQCSVSSCSSDSEIISRKTCVRPATTTSQNQITQQRQ